METRNSCSKCGALNRADADFCTMCYQKLTGAGSGFGGRVISAPQVSHGNVIAFPRRPESSNAPPPPRTREQASPSDDAIPIGHDPAELDNTDVSYSKEAGYSSVFSSGPPPTGTEPGADDRSGVLFGISTEGGRGYSTTTVRHMAATAPSVAYIAEETAEIAPVETWAPEVEQQPSWSADHAGSPHPFEQFDDDQPPTLPVAPAAEVVTEEQNLGPAADRAPEVDGADPFEPRPAGEVAPVVSPPLVDTFDSTAEGEGVPVASPPLADAFDPGGPAEPAAVVTPPPGWTSPAPVVEPLPASAQDWVVAQPTAPPQVLEPAAAGQDAEPAPSSGAPLHTWKVPAEARSVARIVSEERPLPPDMRAPRSAGLLPVVETTVRNVPSGATHDAELATPAPVFNDSSPIQTTESPDEFVQHAAESPLAPLDERVSESPLGAVEQETVSHQSEELAPVIEVPPITRTWSLIQPDQSVATSPTEAAALAAAAPEWSLVTPDQALAAPVTEAPASAPTAPAWNSSQIAQIPPTEAAEPGTTTDTEAGTGWQISATLEPQPVRTAAWPRWFLAAFFVVAWLVPGILTMLVARRLSFGSLLDASVVLQLIGYSGAGALIAYGVKKLHKGDWSSLGIDFRQASLDELAWGGALGLLLIGLWTPIGLLLNGGRLGLDTMVRAYVGETTGIGLLLAGIMIVVGAPVIEEVFFRGLLYSRFMRRGAWVAIVGTSVLFVLAHFNILLIPLWILAFTLGIRRQTRSLWYTIGAHAAWNFVVICIGAWLVLGPPATFAAADDSFAVRYPKTWERLAKIEQTFPGGAIDLAIQNPTGSFISVSHYELAGIPPNESLPHLLRTLQQPAEGGKVTPGDPTSSNEIFDEFPVVYEARGRVIDKEGRQFESHYYAIMHPGATRAYVFLEVCPERDCSRSHPAFEEVTEGFRLKR